MKKTKEVQPILTALFAINQTSEHKDQDIALILDYAFRTLFECNTNLIIMACAGKDKETIMPEVRDLLDSETGYKKYLEEYEE